MSQKHVLLIEDDRVFQSVVEQFLIQQNYAVHCVEYGEQGVSWCQQNTPDIVLCDLMLPDINGLEVIERLLSLAPHLPVIVISASDDMGDIREAVRLGAWDYLVKPIDRLDTITQAIEHCLQRHRLEETYVSDIWELDSHINQLYQDDHIVARLANDLLAKQPLNVGDYHIESQVAAGAEANIWIDYRPLTEGRVLIVMATAHSQTEQNLIPLLVLKTLIAPLIRQHLAGSDDTILDPRSLVQHINFELCHSRVRTAFDGVFAVLDTEQHAFRWTQVGDRLRMQPQAKPDLALGIWRHASFHNYIQTKLKRVHCQLPEAILSIERQSSSSSSSE
ncbi:response regulator [Idiomarina baltica]|uniref:Response regulator of sigma subunit, serine phosphatase (CheY-RsbU) n=1 Tax=Idiomarina baltica OS145 TaxID=314276 RepID=A0ABP2CRX6_9GAMM|nr:response regulator [Idiomarina baltica]EAQ31882.1 Response regulator of sigma subunit, serine phosphatase (CheY-RsbU) [Idiomarina baltica OS145]